MEEPIDKLRKDMLQPETPIEMLEWIQQTVASNEEASRYLWNSDELVFVLLQNFTSSFYTLNTEHFDDREITKIRLCIDILTEIAKNINIEDDFLKLQVDYYIYPFLLSSDNESIKVSALKLFSTLLKDGVHEGVRVSEILPLLLKIIDSSSEICQLLALETLDHVLHGSGLDYAVQTLDRFRAIDVVLSSLVKNSIHVKNAMFLKYLLKVYTRLCERNNVKMKIKEKPPEGLESKEMMALCNEDPELQSLLKAFIRILN